MAALMPATATRRTTTRKSTLKAYRLTTGDWSVPANPPDFGTASPPDNIRTVRVVKDILPVGRHKIGFDESGKPVFWNVTPAVLAQILADFNTMKANGVGSNLGKTHGDDNLLIHPDDLIAPVDELKIEGDRLWMSAYVTPEEAVYLSNPARKVSVGVIPDHVAGDGKKYRQYLTHVAVTDRPVVAGQSPFLALADGGGGGGMDQELVDAINVFLEALGQGPLVEVTDIEQLKLLLKDRASAMGEAVREPETTEQEGGGAPVPGEEPMPGMPMPMRDRLRKQDAEIKRLSDELAANKKKAADDARAAFVAECTRLNKAGVTKAVTDGKLALADRLKCHDLTMLSGLTPTVPVGRTLASQQANATPSEPATDGPNPDDEKKRVAQDIADRRGIKLEDALKLVP